MDPVTGPFTELVQTADYTSHRKRWRQVPPYNIALPYRYDMARKTFGPSIYQSSLATLAGFPSGVYDDLASRAYDKFKAAVSDRASLGVSLAEFSQSYAMIAARATQLFQFGRALKSFKFGDAAAALRTSIPKGVSKSKSVSRNYLEFHFGWSPLVGDIYSAIDVLQGPVTPKKVFGQANRAKAWSKSENYPPSLWTYGYKDDWDFCAFRIGAKIAVSNPNLWLANKLGLINPATIVYELIPFSFVLDWFVNVQNVISSMTDFLGLEIQDAYYSRLQQGTKTVKYQPGPPDWIDLVEVFSWVNSTRDQGMVTPDFYVRPFKPWGLRRAAAAVSLLTLQLKSIR